MDIFFIMDGDSVFNIQQHYIVKHGNLQPKFPIIFPSITKFFEFISTE